VSAQLSDVAELLYFGKLPSRGDFVRSAGNQSLIVNLDKWQSQMMERLALDPRWKLIYDAAPAMHFALVGTASTVGLAGHWMASQDASGRRFPFIAACAFDLSAPREFAPVASEALTQVWARLETMARKAHAATELDLAQTGPQAAFEPFDIAPNVSGAQAAFDEFLETHSIARLEQMLAAGGQRMNLRQAALALGLLLQPAMAQGASRLSKSLCLPLPRDAGVRGVVGAWWLSLVLGFFERHAVELLLFVVDVNEQPQLVVGFQGASASALNAVIDPAVLAQQGVFLNDSEWVEEEVDGDWGLRKLSNYMRDPSLSLGQALQTYREVFLGA
jgi:type VI secretion system protein ImpM